MGDAAASDRRAMAALLAVQILFSAWPVAAKHLFPVLGTFGLLSVRVVGAAIVLAALHPLLVRRRVPASQWRHLLLLALLGVVLNQGLFLSGLERTTATRATLAITTIPVFTYAIAVAMRREEIGPRRLAGILLALVGAAYLVVQNGLDGGWRGAVGDAMVIANAGFFALYLVLSKPWNERYDPLSVTTWTFAWGAILLLPVGLVVDVPSRLADLSETAWAWLAFAILGSSVLTYLLNAIALRRVPASTVAVFIYLQPIGTAILASWSLDERIGWALLPPALLVFGGVWLVARRRPRALEGVTATE